MVNPAAYVEHFSNAFLDFCNLLGEKDYKKYVGELYIDCANGVGATALTGTMNNVEPFLKMKLYNTETSNPERLNE